MNLKRNNINQIAGMFFITILVQFISLIRGSIVAYKFGISIELDALNFSMSTIGVLFSFISAGIGTILIPNLVKNKKGEDINTFITFIVFISFFIMILSLLFSNEISRLLSKNNNQYFLKICGEMIQIISINSFICIITSILTAILNANNSFNSAKIINLINIILIVSGMLLFSNLNIYLYSLIILGSSFVSMVFSFYAVKKYNFKYRFIICLNDTTKNMIKAFLPVILSSALYQVSILIDNTIAIRLGEGQISILNYSNTIISMITILIIGNIGTYLYPKLSKDIIYNKYKIFNYITVINLITSLIIVLFLVEGKDLIKILFERGSFTRDITYMVYICCVLYISTMQINGMRDLIYKYFFIFDDTKTPLKNSLLISIINIISSIWLSKYMGIYGVVIGTVLGNLISIIIILIKFKNSFGFPNKIKKYLYVNTYIFFMPLIIIIIMNFIKHKFIINNIFFTIFLYSIFSSVIYIGGLLIIKKDLLFVIKELGSGNIE